MVCNNIRMVSLSWKTERRKVSSLVPYDKNPRRLTEVQAQQLTKSLERFNLVEIPAVNTDGVVVAGHQRLAMLKALGRGDEVVDVRVPNRKLSTAELKEYNLRSNKNTGEWDLGILASDFDIEMLKDVGFTDAELSKIPFEGLDPNNLNDVPPVPDAATSKLGDLFVLGGHRLLCGDSCKVADVQRLMGGKLAECVFTDPPYGVSVNQGSTQDLKRRHRRIDGKKITNDELVGKVLYNFLLSSFKNMCQVMRPGAAIYVCHSDTERLNFLNAFIAAGLEFKEVLVWVKNSLVMGRQDYHWRHEPILYGWKPGAAHRWYGDRKNTTVFENFPCLQIIPLIEKRGFHITVSTAENHVSFEVPSVKVLEAFTGDKSSVWYFNRPASSKEHPTMKPVELITRALNNSSKRGDIVLDLFGGSGSTLIAAEHLGRLGYLMELSPLYVDVIIKRWEDATGKKAVKL